MSTQSLFWVLGSHMYDQKRRNFWISKPSSGSTGIDICGAPVGMPASSLPLESVQDCMPPAGQQIDGPSAEVNEAHPSGLDG